MRFKRVRNCGVKSCSAINLLMLWFRPDGQQFLHHGMIGAFQLRSNGPSGMNFFSCSNANFRRASCQGRKSSAVTAIVTGRPPKSFVAARKLVEKTQPPLPMPRAEAGQRIVQQQQFRLENQRAGERRALPPVGRNVRRRHVGQRRQFHAIPAGRQLPCAASAVVKFF